MFYESASKLVCMYISVYKQGEMLLWVTFATKYYQKIKPHLG